MEFTIIPVELIRGYVFTNRYGSEKFYYWPEGAPEGEFQSFESLEQAFRLGWPKLTEIVLREEASSLFGLSNG